MGKYRNNTQNIYLPDGYLPEAITNHRRRLPHVTRTRFRACGLHHSAFSKPIILSILIGSENDHFLYVRFTLKLRFYTVTKFNLKSTILIFYSINYYGDNKLGRNLK